jgi:multisubunit Na+/H+ antiporter MnhB subunit
MAKRVTRIVGSDSPLAYLKIVLGFTVVLVGGSVAVSIGGAAGPRLDQWLLQAASTQPWQPLRLLAASLIALASLGVVGLRRWTTRLISLSLAGFLTTFYYVLYRAPDLALTQVLVETVSLVLILLLLGRFPRTAEEGEEGDRGFAPRKVFALAVAVASGGLMTTLILVVTARPHADPIGPWFLAATRPLAHGDNAVNTLLVDFRGFDTLGEMSVLLIATLGCLGLFLRYKRSAAEWRQAEKGPPGYGVHPGKDRP